MPSEPGCSFYQPRYRGVPKHRFNWNFIADLPFGKGQTIRAAGEGPVLDRVMGGWQVAGSGSTSSR